MKGETAAGLREVAAMIVRIVRFKSGLSDDQVQAVMEDRAPRYQEVPGLAQKYYLRFSEPREYGAVYVWDSEQSLKNFNDSELARSIPDAYQVEGAPEGEVAEVMLVLRPDPIARHTATDLMVNSFEGFPNDTFEFIVGLRENNNKGWFEAHRSDYEDFYLEPARAFVLDVGPALKRISPEVRAKPKVGRPLFRINRDIRFSSDKPRSAQSHSRRRASPLYIDHTVSIVSASSGRLSGR